MILPAESRANNEQCDCLVMTHRHELPGDPNEFIRSKDRRGKIYDEGQNV